MISNLVKKVQTQYQTTTCRKKKSEASRFDTPWAPSDETSSEEKMGETKEQKIIF